jgi:hypothetical protein
MYARVNQRLAPGRFSQKYNMKSFGHSWFRVFPAAGERLNAEQNKGTVHRIPGSKVL